MKKTFTLLILLIAVVCGWQFYRLAAPKADPALQSKGALSDIAEEVTAIPLRSTGGYEIDSVHFIRQDGDDLFLISRGTLFRFNRQGDFIGRITDPATIRVGGYIIDPMKKMLIVMGNVNDVFYYDYDGRLISRKKLNREMGNTRIHSFAMHNKRIFASEQHLHTDGTMEECVVEYDSNWNQLSKRAMSRFPNDREVIGCIEPQLAFLPDSGDLYAWTDAGSADHLQQDTLLLKHRLCMQSFDSLEGNRIPLLPFRMGRRIWLASRTDSDHPGIYCFDSLTNKSILTAEGLKDDFFHTGNVSDLEPADSSGMCYTFVRDASNRLPVIYLVKTLA